MRRVDSLEKTLMLGGIGGRRRRRRQRMRWLDGITSLTRWTWVWMNSGSWCWTGRPGVLRFMGSQRVRRLSDWTELNCISTSFVDHNGYSISSEGFLPAVVDIMVIWVKFTHSSPFEFADHFAFSYCSWGSQVKNTEVVCHSLLPWTTFCQISPPWPARLGSPHGHGLVSLS